MIPLSKEIIIGRKRKNNLSLSEIRQKLLQSPRWKKIKEELIVDARFNLFDKSVHDPMVIASNIVNYYPLSQVSASSTVFEFAISGEGESYIDTANIKLKVTGTIKQTDGTSAADVKDGTVNNLLYSLFNQVDVSYNDRLLTESTNNYSYITY